MIIIGWCNGYRSKPRSLDSRTLYKRNQNQKKSQKLLLGGTAYLPCSLGATESNLRLGERRTLKLRVCDSFMCWCSTVALKESTEEVILEVGTRSWVFVVETFVECSCWNRVWDISKRCSMKIREGKSISWKGFFFWSLGWIVLQQTNLVQCFYVIANPLQSFSHRLGRSNVRAIHWHYQKSSFSSVCH